MLDIFAYLPTRDHHVLRRDNRISSIVAHSMFNCPTPAVGDRERLRKGRAVSIDYQPPSRLLSTMGILDSIALVEHRNSALCISRLCPDERFNHVPTPNPIHDKEHRNLGCLRREYSTCNDLSHVPSIDQSKRLHTCKWRGTCTMLEHLGMSPYGYTRTWKASIAVA